MKYTRREFGTTMLAGLALSPLAAAARINSEAGGVQLGVQTFSFHEITHGGMQAVDRIIADMTSIGLGTCELFSVDIEPALLPTSAFAAWSKFDPQDPVGGADAPNPVTPDNPLGGPTAKQREDLLKWRLSAPLSYFSDVAKKFAGAGIKMYAFNLSFDDSFTDEEIERGFEMAKELGTNIITASASLSVLKRLAPVAEKHKTYVSMHNHANIKDTNHFATPDSFGTALEMSKYFKVNLDIGHFWVAGFDPVTYIEQHHADITNIHVKDRLRSSGIEVPWREERPDDTPFREVLLLLKKNRWPIPALIECGYAGPGSSREEVAKCYAYAKKILQA